MVKHTHAALQAHIYNTCEYRAKLFLQSDCDPNHTPNRIRPLAAKPCNAHPHPPNSNQYWQPTRRQTYRNCRRATVQFSVPPRAVVLNVGLYGGQRVTGGRVAKLSRGTVNITGAGQIAAESLPQPCQIRGESLPNPCHPHESLIRQAKNQMKPN